MVKKNRIHRAQLAINFDDDFASIASIESKRQSSLNIMNDEDTVTTHNDVGRGKKRRKLLANSASPEKDLEERDDDFSVATGTGRNALLSLLSLVDGNGQSDDVFGKDDDDVSMANEELLSFGGSNELLEGDEYVPSCEEDEKIDTRSFARANNDDGFQGARALQFLLTQSKNIGGKDKKQAAKQPAKKKAKKKGIKSKADESKKTKAKVEDVSDINTDDTHERDATAMCGMSSEEEASVASGAGRNALASLLANIKHV